MSKTIDLSKSVYDLSREYPEVIEIMKQLGFESIGNPVMLKTAGRVMTIPKGAQTKGIPLETIKKTFAEHGFETTE